MVDSVAVVVEDIVEDDTEEVENEEPATFELPLVLPFSWTVSFPVPRS